MEGAAGMIFGDSGVSEVELLQGESKRFAMALQISDSDNIAEELIGRYRLLLDNSGFPVTYMDRDGLFLFVTKQGAANLGDTSENIAGRTVYDYFPKHDADEYVRRFRDVIDNDRAKTFEDEVVLQDGNRWFLSILHPLKDSSGSVIGVQVVSHDISDRKIAEDALEERLRFEQLIATLASKFVNLSTSEVSQSVNAALRSIGEYMRVDRSLLFEFSSDFQSLSCTHEWHRPGIDPAQPRLTESTNAQFPWLFNKLLLGEVVVISNPVELPDAASAERDAFLAHGVCSTITAPIRISGKTVGALCFDSLSGERDWSGLATQRVKLLGQLVFNSIERTRIETELQESRELVRAATDASPHVTYIFDFTELKCIYISAQVERELGYTPTQVYSMGGSVVTDHLHPDDLNRLGELLDRWTHASDDDVLETKIRLRNSDGHWRWYVSRERVLKRAPEGFVSQIIGTMRDITDQKKAEEELQSHREKLIHVARLSTMGEMVAGIAHELGQPLYSILNFAKASHNVLETLDDSKLADARQWNEHVVRSAARAGDIIRRLRDFARQSAPKREHIDICDVVDEALNLVAFETRRLGIQVERVLADHLLIVRADRVQLLQVLVNLIQNGFESMADVAMDQRLLVVRATDCDNHVEVCIVDHGCGMPNIKPSVFDAFVTTKKDGMGMGLAICKTLVEGHDGKLEGFANEDRGTTFRLVLPRVDSGSEQ